MFQKNEWPNLLGMTGGTPDCRNRRISKSCWAEIGHVCIAERVNFQIRCSGNWTQRMSEKIEFPQPFAENRIFFLLVSLWLMHIVCYTNVECTLHAWTGSPRFFGGKRRSWRV